MPLTLIVHLYSRKPGLSALRVYEQKVLPILSDHQGRIVTAFSPSPDMSTGDELPDEIHIVTFPSQHQFETYKSDPRHAALAQERQQVIARTEIIASGQYHSYE